MKNDFLKQVKGKLIVSCQALPDEPLYSSFIMGRMAHAATLAGAAGIRANSVVDIESIQDETTLPIIGIIKREYADSQVYITPTIKEMRAVATTGVSVVACDVTRRERPCKTDLSEIVLTMREEFPDTLLMADTGSIADVETAISLGFDIIGTTMHGYTSETAGMNIADNDFSYLKQVLATSDRPVICEGKIDTPEKARRVLELGAYAVVVGGAITRPQEIASRFIDAIQA
ncbi:N-acetylmannosamine-6-phosphate 2-epimerase [Lapidilactobacillus salsurivasis]